MTQHDVALLSLGWAIGSTIWSIYLSHKLDQAKSAIRQTINGLRQTTKTIDDNTALNAMTEKELSYLRKFATEQTTTIAFAKRIIDSRASHPKDRLMFDNLQWVQNAINVDKRELAELRIHFAGTKTNGR